MGFLCISFTLSGRLGLNSLSSSEGWSLILFPSTASPGHWTTELSISIRIPSLEENSTLSRSWFTPWILHFSPLLWVFFHNKPEFHRSEYLGRSFAPIFITLGDHNVSFSPVTPGVVHRAVLLTFHLNDCFQNTDFLHLILMQGMNKYLRLTCKSRNILYIFLIYIPVYIYIGVYQGQYLWPQLTNNFYQIYNNAGMKDTVSPTIQTVGRYRPVVPETNPNIESFLSAFVNILFYYPSSAKPGILWVPRNLLTFSVVTVFQPARHWWTGVIA